MHNTWIRYRVTLTNLGLGKEGTKFHWNSANPYVDHSGGSMSSPVLVLTEDSPCLVYVGVSLLDGGL